MMRSAVVGYGRIGAGGHFRQRSVTMSFSFAQGAPDEMLKVMRYELDRARFCFCVGLRRILLGDLAKRAGLSAGFLSNLKSGRRRASATQLQNLARVLEVPEGYLLPERSPENALAWKFDLR